MPGQEFPFARRQCDIIQLRPREWKGLSSRISSEIRQRATFFAREGVRGRNRAGGQPFAGGLQGIGKWRQTRACIQVSSRLHSGRPNATPREPRLRIGKEGILLASPGGRTSVRASPGNDIKVAFRPGKLKGVSSRKQSECWQNFVRFVHTISIGQAIRSSSDFNHNFPTTNERAFLLRVKGPCCRINRVFPQYHVSHSIH